MSMESVKTNPEVNVSPMEWEALEKQANEFLVKIYEHRGNVMSSFRHITGNLVVMPDTIEDLRRKKNTVAFIRLKKQFEYLERYLKLLDEFPQFKEKEISEEFGMFPDIYSETLLPRNLIEEMEKRLGGNN